MIKRYFVRYPLIATLVVLVIIALIVYAVLSYLNPTFISGLFKKKKEAPTNTKLSGNPNMPPNVSPQQLFAKPQPILVKPSNIKNTMKLDLTANEKELLNSIEIGKQYERDLAKKEYDEQVRNYQKKFSYDKTLRDYMINQLTINYNKKLQIIG